MIMELGVLLPVFLIPPEVVINLSLSCMGLMFIVGGILIAIPAVSMIAKLRLVQVGVYIGFGFRSLVVLSCVRDPRCSVFGLLVLFLLRWFCLPCRCVALRCSALPCVRFVCSGRDELTIVPVGMS